MLETTYNKRYECDRCGTVREYITLDPSWTPRGWYSVSGRDMKTGAPIEEAHFCPECGGALFGEYGYAYGGSTIEMLRDGARVAMYYKLGD